MNKSKRTGLSEITELQVWITSPEAECDAYPSATSDESCESITPFIMKEVLLSLSCAYIRCATVTSVFPLSAQIIFVSVKTFLESGIGLLLSNRICRKQKLFAVC